MKLKMCQLLLMLCWVCLVLDQPLIEEQQIFQVENSLSDSESGQQKGTDVQKQIDSVQDQSASDENGNENEEPEEKEENGEKGENQEKDQNKKEGENSNGDHETEGENTQHESHSHYHKPNELQFWINVLVAALLTCVGGFCSGMGVGLMSIEKIELEMMSLSNNEEEQKIGNRILSVVKNHHLFLVTLLLANAMALQSLPLVVHSLMPDWAAILFSTFIVLVIGEIVPQAYCTGPKKITIAYYAAPIILTMIKVLWILAYPMAKGLDYLLGVHGHQRIQHKDFANFLKGSQNLRQTETLLLTSILELRCQRVNSQDIMVPLEKLYMLSESERLNSQKVAQINKKDFSYILVYKERRSNLIGVIKTKEFALKYLKNGCKTMIVRDILDDTHNVLNVYADTNLLEMLMLFQSQSYRYAVVIGKKKKIEPGKESIMYSKSDMIAKKVDGEVLGVIFLYRIFEEIAEYNNQVQAGHQIPHTEEIEMDTLHRPLIEK